jgi:DNA adenine methylase
MKSDYSKARSVTTGYAKPAPSPFAYYGAKQRLSSKIIQLLPPHNAWVEAFCGSAALTLAKAPAPIEVINDLNGHIVNLFRQLRDNSDALCKAVALTPYASQEFDDAHSDDRGVPALEKARRFLVKTMMTVNGTVEGTRSGFSFSQSFSRGGREARVNRWFNLPDRLQEIVQRLRCVRVERRDARELLQMFIDRPASLVYLDPPYFTKRDHGYVIDANDEQFHTELLDICINAQCMILLSGYDNKLYQETLVKANGWTKRRIKTHTRDTTGKDYERTEILWMNDRLIRARKVGRVPVRLSQKERRENKINPSRTSLYRRKRACE